MWNDHDAHTGIAEPSPIFDDVYGHTRQDDPISHGQGFVSKVKSTDEWIAPDATITAVDPGDAPLAPRFRGYGPGFLTYIIEPDVAEDFYKHTETGLFTRIQQARAVAPWWPDINDNDLLIHVTLDRQGKVIGTHERYQAKMGDPISVRGLDRRGRRGYGQENNRHVVQQTFDMTLLPELHPAYGVEIDR